MTYVKEYANKHNFDLIYESDNRIIYLDKLKNVIHHDKQSKYVEIFKKEKKKVYKSGDLLLSLLENVKLH